MPAVACSEHISMYKEPFTVINPNVGNPRHAPSATLPLHCIPLTIVRFTAQDGAWSAHHDARKAKSLKNPKLAILPQFCVLQEPPPTLALMGASAMVGELAKHNGDGAADAVGNEARKGDEVKELVSYSMMRLVLDANN
jgi:hypothetical protein